MARTKLTNLFPPVARGGYSVRLHFLDEARGERWFNHDWGVCDYGTPGRFRLTCLVNHRGDNLHDVLADTRVVRDLRPGDRVTADVTRWTVRGRSGTSRRLIEILGVRTIEGETVWANTVEVLYQFPDAEKT